MKKSLLIALAAACCASAASAKSLTFVYEGQDVPQNGTIEYTQYEEYPNGPTEIEIFMKPELFIKNDVAETFSVKTTSNYPVQLCIGGQCTAAVTNLKDDLNFTAGSTTDLLLDCSLYFNKDEAYVVPAIEVLIEAWYNSDPSTVTTMTLKMGNTAGIGDITSAPNRVSFANNSLNFNVNGACDVVVYNLAGRAVKSQKVNGNASVNLESLPVGVYIYRTSGAAATTGKFIIR